MLKPDSGTWEEEEILEEDEFGFRHVKFEVLAGHPRGDVCCTFGDWV